MAKLKQGQWVIVKEYAQDDSFRARIPVGTKLWYVSTSVLQHCARTCGGTPTISFLPETILIPADDQAESPYEFP